MLLSCRRVFVCKPFQLASQNALESSASVVNGALKFVTPVGLSHTIEGGSSAICLSSSGVQSSFSEGGGKTGESFDSVSSSELS